MASETERVECLTQEHNTEQVRSIWSYQVTEVLANNIIYISCKCMLSKIYLGMNSEVKAITKEFTKTANQLIVRRIPNQIPIP